MARIRTIKPEFWTDEKVVELSPFGRLLFIGLWNFCDDDGRMVYSPKRMKMQIFPADQVDCAGLVLEIQAHGLVTAYTVEGVEYLQVDGFSKHQKIDKRAPSKHPAPPIPPDSPRIAPTFPDSPQLTPNLPDGRDQGRDQVREEEPPLSPRGEIKGASKKSPAIPLCQPSCRL